MPNTLKRAASASMIPQLGHTVAAVVLAALAVLAVLAVSASPSSAVAPQASEYGQSSATSVAAKNRPCITRAEYVKLKTGMTLSLVGKIVGTKGEILHGDIALHTRLYVSCVAVDNETFPVCMNFARAPRPNGTFGVARLDDKDVSC